MLKARKEQLEARGEKGFTLMEMLIVIAIIAILIAIAIPIFTSQLNAAKAATDEANARALYAQLAADYQLDSIDTAPNPTSLSGAGTVTYDGTTYTFSDVCTNLTISIPGNAAPSVTLETNGQTARTFG